MEQDIDLAQKTNEIILSLFDQNKQIEQIEKKFIKIQDYSREFEYNGLIVSSVYYYFFPAYKNYAKNTGNQFWFDKFKNNNNNYTEFNYAIDILINLKEYFEKKDEKEYFRESFEAVKRFSSYKNIDLFLLFTKDKFKELVSHISAYLTRDLNYFKQVLSIEINENDDLEDFSTLKKLFFEEVNYESLVRNEENEIKFNQLTEKIYEIKNEHLQKEEKVAQIIEELKNKNSETERLVNDLKNEKIIEIERLNKDIEKINEKIDKIYLRDTIKYSIRYIYRMFYSKFGNEKFEYNVYEEIKQLKNILNQPQFKTTYSFLLNFIENKN